MVTVGWLYLSAIYRQNELGRSAAGWRRPASRHDPHAADRGRARVVTDPFGLRLCTTAGVVLLTSSLLARALLAPAAATRTCGPDSRGFGMGRWPGDRGHQRGGHGRGGSTRARRAAGPPATARRAGGTVGLAAMGVRFRRRRDGAPPRPAIGARVEAGCWSPRRCAPSPRWRPSCWYAAAARCRMLTATADDRAPPRPARSASGWSWGARRGSRPWDGPGRRCAPRPPRPRSWSSDNRRPGAS